MRPWLVFVFMTAVGFSQSFQGTLRGRVVDPNGAAASGAVITLIDEATLIKRTALTNDQGDYTFASLTPATYTVEVEAAGFKKLERKSVSVSTQAAVTLDLVLELGLVTEVVADAELMPRTWEFAERLATGPPIAIRITKRMMYKQLSMSLDNALEDAAVATLVANYTDDVKEGIAAFHAKRKPQFKGK